MVMIDMSGRFHLRDGIGKFARAISAPLLASATI
jgi:hypothetical protein